MGDTSVVRDGRGPWLATDGGGGDCGYGRTTTRACGKRRRAQEAAKTRTWRTWRRRRVRWGTATGPGGEAAGAERGDAEMVWQREQGGGGGRREKEIGFGDPIVALFCTNLKH